MAEGGVDPLWEDQTDIDDDDLFLEGPVSNLDSMQSHHTDQNRSPRSRRHFEPISSEGSSGQQLDENRSAITDCPICLDTLERPKALPCLHTFCSDCLSSFITGKVTGANFSSFPCPICRRNTSPLDQTKHYKEWAEQFPTNNTMLEVIRLNQIQTSTFDPPGSKSQFRKMKSAKKTKKENTYCANCQKFNKKTVKANVRCDKCSVNLCENCDSVLHLHSPEKEHRRMYVDSENTKLQVKLSPLRAYPGYAVHCGTHRLKMMWFCVPDGTPICMECIRTDHSCCDQILTLEEYCSLLKRGRSGLKSDLRCSESAIETITELLRQYTTEIYGDRNANIEQIQDVRKNIDSTLDILQDELIKKITDVTEHEESLLSPVIERCEAVTAGLSCSSVRLNTALREGRDREIVAAATYCHFQMRQCVELIKDVTRFHNTPRLSVHLNSALAASLDIESFGEASIYREKRDLPRSVRKLLPLCERDAREMVRFSVRTCMDISPCGITSAVYLPNNLIIFVDFANKAVKLYTDYGHCVHRLFLPSGPWDVCRVDNDTFAITLPFKQTVIFVEFDPRTSSLCILEDRSLRVKIPCYGITACLGQLVVSCPSRKKNTLFTLPEKMSRWIPLKPFIECSLPCWQLVTNKAQREIVGTCDGDPGKILKISTRGTLSEDVVDSRAIKGLRGCDVDREGNIYLCGRASKTVVQVNSKSGSRTLLCPTHGLREPSTVAIHENNLVVAEVGKDEVCVFELF